MFLVVIFKIVQPLVYTKSMILNGALSKDELHKANDREYKRLLERFNSSDYFNAINIFMEQKSLKNKL